MAILNKLIRLLLLIFILSNLHGSFGMQCYHCSFFEQTRIKDNYKMVAGNKKLHFPSDYHSSCAQGQDPANSLIVDCTMEYYEILTKTFRDHPDPESPLENIAKKVERHIQATWNATMNCATVFVNGNHTHNEEDYKVENVYRSCFPNSTSFSNLLLQFQQKFPNMTITGYSCEHEELCNRKNSIEQINSMATWNWDVSEGLVLFAVILLLAVLHCFYF